MLKLYYIIFFSNIIFAQKFENIVDSNNVQNYFQFESANLSEKSLSLDLSQKEKIIEFVNNVVFFHYDEVIIDLQWDTDFIEARANRINETNSIYLRNGILSHKDLGLEAISLIIAHELGHHYGLYPFYEGMKWYPSCEEQADYWAASTAMYKFWGSSCYVKALTNAISQIEKFYITEKGQNIFSTPSTAVGISCQNILPNERIAVYKRVLNNYIRNITQ